MEKEKLETLNSYNKGAKSLAEKFDSIGSRANDIKKAFSYFNDKRNLKVVEIGCGNGRDAKEIIKYTNDYLGVDFSEKLIEIAKQNVPETNFKIADIEEFSFPDNVDIIFSFASLLHSDKNKIKIIFERARNALNKGGIFYISLKYGGYHKETKNNSFGTRTYYFYTPELIARLTGDLYEVINKEYQSLRGQKWFTMVLRKN